MIALISFIAGAGVACMVFGFVAVCRVQKDIDDGR